MRQFVALAGLHSLPAFCGSLKTAPPLRASVSGGGRLAESASGSDLADRDLADSNSRTDTLCAQKRPWAPLPQKGVERSTSLRIRI